MYNRTIGISFFRNPVFLYMIRYLFLFFICITGLCSYAQLGGSGAYQYVNVPVNARVSGLGGKYVSLRDDDIISFMQNPASLNKDMSGKLSVNYMPYLTGVNATTLAYGLQSGPNNLYGIGFTFFDYGKMDETAPDGTITGAFRVNEYVITGGYSHELGNYTLGMNVKLAGSHLGPYSSYAIMTDLGGFYQHPEKDWTIGMVFKNIGYAFKRYTPGVNVRMPLEVIIGTSYKLENLPFRFTISAHNLQRPDIVYLDPNKKGKVDLLGNEVKEKKKIGDQIFRHFIFGGEFLLSKNFHIRVAYNPQRRKEMRLEDRAGVAGMAIGCNLTVKSIGLAYTRSFYHVSGASNHLTLTTSMDRVFKKRELQN